jgi:transposase InsO family protein
MPWKETDVMSLKKQFVTRAISGKEPIADLCQEFGISRKTGHKWRERFLAKGFAGLADRSRRPANSPTALDEDAVCRLIALKLSHPHWGARKLAALWQRAHPEPAPSESTIKRVLSKAGLVTHRRRRRSSADGGRLQARREPTEPNDLWTVDFKGWWSVRGGRRCEPLTVRDGFSRCVLCASPLDSARTESVRAAFERLFERFGLPRTIRSDNGVPFASVAAPLGLSRLSAWWVALGIDLDRIDPGRPDQNGGHERVHRDIAQEVQAHMRGDLSQARASLDLWRREFNEERPHEALGMRCPAEVYAPSPRRWKGTPEDLEYPSGYLVRRVARRTGCVRIACRLIHVSAAVGGWSVGLKPESDGGLGVWFGPLRLGSIDVVRESFAPARAGANAAALDKPGVPGD